MLTLEQLGQRHSVRSFSPEPLPASILRSLKAEITDINTHEAGMHFQLVVNDDSAFKGFRKSYGFFRNPRNYVAAVVDKSFPDVLERAGYCAEQIAMKAIGLGLGTCFVGGTFDATSVPVQIRADWKILFVLLLGYPEVDKRRAMDRLVTRLAHRKEPDWKSFYVDKGIALEEALRKQPALETALKALLTAPSALNKRPVRLTLGSDGKIEAFLPPGAKDRKIDLGIAIWNLEAAVGDALRFPHDECEETYPPAERQ